MTDVAALRSAMLDWYDRHRRTLAWRAPPDTPGDPYRVWLSEIMLQQTTTVHATPYFETFVRRWPTVAALATAPDAEVMAAWAGLGYYARARNLLACARVVAADHGGVFPDTEQGLRALPGLGAYTAAAVAAIAFGRAANVVDGNVERVVARLFAVETPLPAARTELRRLAGTLVRHERPGDWAQALMDLGATVCRPRGPSCLTCPVASFCRARAGGEPERYPVKPPKAERPHRRGAVFVMRDRSGRVAVVTRPAKGLLGGMLGLPTGDWSLDPDTRPPIPADWRQAGVVDHVFTHFALTLEVWTAEVEGQGWTWMEVETARAALPTVFAKALDRAVA